MVDIVVTENTVRLIAAGRAYGRWPGERGKHSMSNAGSELEVIGFGFMDNNSAVYRVVSTGHTFSATAEHFTPNHDGLLAHVREDVSNAYENGYILFDTHTDDDIAGELLSFTDGYENVDSAELKAAIRIVRAEHKYGMLLKADEA